MSVRHRFGIALVGLALAAGCAGGCSKAQPRERVWVPPRVDLARWSTLGIIDFASPTSPGLGAIAAREFLVAIHSAQPGTPVLELGAEPRVLAALGAAALDADAIRALGAKYRVDAVVIGSLEAQTAAPGFAFDSNARWVGASAELDGGLGARIVDTQTGATVWSTLARATEPLGRVEISASGVSGIGSGSADEAKLRLVRDLVERATPEFRGRWE
jgi:hypothetical protein